MEVIPLQDVSAETVSKAFYENWICRFGTPSTIITDQGRQFESQLFRNLATICGCVVKHSTAYHPQCQGKIERLHRTLKAAIKAHNNVRWTDSLPTVLLGLRSAIRTDTDHSISQMVYGKHIKVPGEFFEAPKSQIDPDTFVTNLQDYMKKLQPLRTNSYPNQKIFVHKDLKSCTHVFVRIDRVKKALEKPYEGPFRVVEKFDKYFAVHIKDKPVHISIDRLKPAYMLDTKSEQPVPHTEVFPTPENNLKQTSAQLPSKNCAPAFSKSGAPVKQEQPDVNNKKNFNLSTRSGRQVKLPVRFKL